MNPMSHKPYPVKRAQTKTGIVTPECPWPIESANLDGLVEEGRAHGDRMKGYVKPDGYEPEKYWNLFDGMQCQELPHRTDDQYPAMAVATSAASSSRGTAPPTPTVAHALYTPCHGQGG